MKSIRIRVIRDWQDLDWIFSEGEEVEVYDTPPDNIFYFICYWGYRLIPKTHCQVISEKGGDSDEFPNKASPDKYSQAF